jgi:ferric-dicitrate binding protein FerR (iron transport regulator)
MEFTGTVFLDQLDAWLAALAETFPVEIRTRGGSRWIQRHPDPSVAARSAAAH